MLIVVPIWITAAAYRYQKRTNQKSLSRIRNELAKKEGATIDQAAPSVPRPFWMIAVTLLLIAIAQVYSFLRVQFGTTPFELKTLLGMVLPAIVVLVHLLAATSLFVRPKLAVKMLGLLSIFALYNLSSAALSPLSKVPVVVGGLSVIAIIYLVAFAYVYRVNRSIA